MKKRGKLAVCICAMIACVAMTFISVYAVTRPELQVTGTISYTANHVNALVLGKIVDVKDSSGNTTTSYPSATITEAGYASNTLVNSSLQYLGYSKDTTSTSSTLPNWSIGSIKFVKNSNNELQSAKISIKIVNFSSFPIICQLTPTAADFALASANVSRTINSTAQVLQSNEQYEFEIVYSVVNSEVAVSSFNIGFSINMERSFS